jgi:protein-S-isoprenylcysteine O-methyltransferase Ste14
MKDLTLLFILVCFIIQIIIWIISAFSTKSTKVDLGGWYLRITAIIIFGALIFFRQQVMSALPFLGIEIWSRSLTLGVIADLIVLIGMIIMIWARITIGKNWSANIVLKENHELIIKGPYQYIRHPIYSGLLLMVLGIAIYSGLLSEILLFILFFFGVNYKANREEKLLIEHFADKYTDYRNKIKAFIPFVL